MAPVLAVAVGMKSVVLILSLVAVILGIVAQPARAQQTPPRPQSVAQNPETGNGEWWESFQKDANAGNDFSTGLRWGVVHGCMGGFEASLILQTSSFDEFNKRRAARMRSDLTMNQILAKVDGFYAEPGNQKVGICTAVLTALRPFAER